ncbi:MAG: cob(I)yrinic acid a,c-diamide adenosyltransferase [Alphaproteobacteria bacterium]|nr:cob(I)yrinic acid a,c-diamide adenosyltransferase [Alphaproteobacteria bacterium]
MVQLTRIYTKGGDTGKTSLGTKGRVSKASLRIAAIGDVDEANANIGVARLPADEEINLLLSHIQNDLFDLGADLCVPLVKNQQKRLRIDPHQTTFLEEKIDYYNKFLPPLNSFVLPGGSPLSTTLHQARTVVRRAERTVCALYEMEPINKFILQYLNRLSDLLFVLARFANHKEAGDVLWVPGAYR